MKKILATSLVLSLFLGVARTQTPPQKPDEFDEIIRVTTELVQTDVVVMDKNEQIVGDLKLEDFEVFDNGRKQDLQFMEFVSIEGPGRKERSTSNVAKIAPGVDTSIAADLTAKELKRVVAFVVDDVTIPNEDMVRVRAMLTDFVENKMREGDLVAIVRTVGGKGLLEQFTSDRQILRRAISQLGVRSLPPHLTFGGPEAGRISGPPSAVEDVPSFMGDPTASETVSSGGGDFDGPSEGTNQIPRALLALSVSNSIIDSLRQVPGRKNLVLVSGGLPLFDLTRGGSVVADVGRLFQILTDNATRSGVVINTMDIRGLKTHGAVASFVDTPAKSALGGGTLAGDDFNVGFGRGMDVARLGDRPPTEILTLRTLASTTGGVSIVNSNSFGDGLNRVLNRSLGYYRLAYRPAEKFDNKFHKLEVKVKRAGVRVHGAEGYFAREDKAAADATKEDQIVAAAASPLAKRDLDVAADLQYQFTPDNKAQLDINAFINANKLNFKKTPDGKYHTTFDVVGFVFDQLGKSRGGMSQTVNVDLTEDNYRRALATGLSYSANTQLPPGYYQVRLVIRETETGKIGTVSRYFEVPDLTNKQLNMSSILLYGVKPGADVKTTPEQLPATRVISRQQDLRYAAIVYNAKAEGGKTQGKSQLIISQGNKVLFREPEQALVTAGRGPGQYIKIGQIGLAKVPPGNYVLTLIVTDPLADKKRQIVSRSVGFTVAN